MRTFQITRSFPWISYQKLQKRGRRCAVVNYRFARRLAGFDTLRYSTQVAGLTARNRTARQCKVFFLLKLTSSARAIARAAKESYFIKRERTLNGSNFVQTLVFGWLANPSSSLEELTQTAATLGVSISPQGLDQRFTPDAASFLKQVLDEAVATIVSSNPVAIPLLMRFNGIYIQDSSIIRLPDELCDVWTGCGGSSPKNTSSSVKLQVRWDFSAGGITGPTLQSGRENDKSSPLMDEPLPSGALWIADLGYFSLTLLADFSSEEVYWLTRLKSNCVLYDKDSNAVRLPAVQGNAFRAFFPCRISQ